MPQRIIVDAGPIIGLLHHSDQWHAWSLVQFKRFSVFETCDAVIAEACARMNYAGFDQADVLRLVESGIVKTTFNSQPNVARIVRQMEKYEDLPMDFADACLVTMSEENRDCLLVTTDKSDFSVYRRFGRDMIPILAP